MTRPLRICIADDEPVIRTFLKKLLTIWGHDVVATAEDGQQLVELCKALQPDLVITDVSMPVLSGLEAAMQICADHEIPIIVISAYPELVERNETPNIKACLVKPIRMPDLERAISSAAAEQHPGR